MPLSTVCVSTVSSRPRLWSSHINIRLKDRDMNSTEEISIYREPRDFYPSPSLQRRTLNYSYDFPEKSQRKDKKWSIGSFFRRKKKEESESSSEEDQKKGFLSRRKKKSENKRKKPQKTIGTFDHVVIPRQPNACNGYSNRDDSGILSDPSGGFVGYLGRTPSKAAVQESSCLDSLANSKASLESGDSFTKRTKKELTKARAIARRTTVNRDSSSEEDSLSSLRIRSDENLTRQRDNSTNKKSRAARTERYLKRHSRDGENPYNYLRLSKSDAENSALNWRLSDESNRSPSRSPVVPKNKVVSHSSLNSSISGLSTIPPGHGYRVSNSTSNPSYKPPLSMNDYNKSINKQPEYKQFKSVSCENNIHKAPSNDVIHVQFPIVRPNRNFRNLSLIDPTQLNRARHPPQPPPRDPSRFVGNYFEAPRPTTFYFDGQMRSQSFNSPQVAQYKFINPKSFNSGHRSTSEVYLPKEPPVTSMRPSSATPQPQRSSAVRTADNYNYLTDKKPRSRKPIFIKPNTKSMEGRKDSPTQKAIDFWKQIEDNVNSNAKNVRPNSPKMFTSTTEVKTQIFLPHSDTKPPSNDLKPPIGDLKPPASPVRNESPFKPIETNKQPLTKEEIKRKSSNLEEALDELEAIYNSLRLGDEDLLERAEQREKESAAKRLQEANLEPYPGWKINRGAYSDSGFAYEPFDQVDSPKKKKVIRKSRIPNIQNDDMYNRKMNKERSATISDPQSVVSKISYLYTSPVHVASEIGDHKVVVPQKSKEPDITFDDVMYRNVKHANTCPKVIEPQPPFGIPLEPVIPAPNSDYLHAVPENIYTPPYKHKKIPDIVKDDLAFRNLRKDGNKEPALPESRLDVNDIKKRRAVRSLSANISSLVKKELDKKMTEAGGVENEFKTLTNDIADAMEIARKVLQEKDKNISETKKAFMSDTDADYAHQQQNGDVFKESRINFLNGLKTSRLGDTVSSKPPIPSKESTPIPKSPLEEKNSDKTSTNSSLEDLLNALAEEAKETTERITKELEMLGHERERRSSNINKEELDKKLSEINKVSEHAKLCEKLLGAVVDSTELISASKTPVEEIVEEIEVTKPAVESANLVEDIYKRNEGAESDHDYENLTSDKDLRIEDDPDTPKCQSPFEEKKSEILAAFQVLKQPNEDDGPGKQSTRRSRSRLPRWLRPHSCPEPSMSEDLQESRAERVARYKEERRRQLAAQFGNAASQKATTGNGAASSSGSDGGPRTTRASRLRAQAALEREAGGGGKVKQTNGERVTPSPFQNGLDTRRNSKQERDKSAKRKSNLNRSLTSEEVPPLDSDDPKSRRRRRRFFPQEVLDQAVKDSDASIPLTDVSTCSSTAFRDPPTLRVDFSTPPRPSSTSTASGSVHSPATSPLTAPGRLPSTPKKSDLSVHMENARKGKTPAFSEMGKYKPFSKRSIVTSSPKDKSTPSLLSFRSSSTELTSKSDQDQPRVKETSKRASSSVSDNETNRNIAKRMEELTAYTRETLARVERLANRNRESPVKRVNTSSPLKQAARPSSILKRPSKESIHVEKPLVSQAGPVSILKRKVSQDEHKTEVPTPPVTFSPSVTERPSAARGILKKRRSLDESRRRSRSPENIDDTSSSSTSARSILKTRRRGSLEELSARRSPEIQGILKRRTSKSEEEDHSLSSPQSILKRRSGASSAGSAVASSSATTPHVSITTAVILAAAGGAEMVLDPPSSESGAEHVRPILKRRGTGSSEGGGDRDDENSGGVATPRPILKRRDGGGSEDGGVQEERGMRPILKVKKEASASDAGYTNGESVDCEMRPILKTHRAESPRPRLSFSSANSASFDENRSQQRTSRRSYTICTDFQTFSAEIEREEDREMRKPRPLSVHELVMSFEKTVESTGAIPKRNSNKRNSDRYRTQPVTSNELEESLNLVKTPHKLHFSDDPVPTCPFSPSRSLNSHSLLDFTSSLEEDGHLNSFLSASLHATTGSDGFAVHKMSSDSAFQSLGDGLELEQEEEEMEKTEEKKKSDGLQSQMKAIAMEATKIKLNKVNSGVDRYRSRKTGVTERSSRFSTQPVTFEEVQEASKITTKTEDEAGADADQPDPCNLSLLDRIRMFDLRTEEPKRRVSFTRRRPVSFGGTDAEVWQRRWRTPHALDGNRDGSPSGRRGVLRSPPPSSISPTLKVSRPPQKEEKEDEGISCNSSGSDSDTERRGKMESSEGESSGSKEVRKIFGGDDRKMKVKQSLEHLLSRPPQLAGGGALRRSRTLAAADVASAGAEMPQSVADLRARLRERGESDWRRRVPLQNNATDEIKLLKDRNRYNEEKSFLSSKKDELDASAKQWKERVEKSDAEKYSVAGKMGEKIKGAVPLISIAPEKKTPKAKKYKGRDSNDANSTPSSPEKLGVFDLSRSKSTPFAHLVEHDTSAPSTPSKQSSGRTVVVPKPDDFTFNTFFESIESNKVSSEKIDLDFDDLDAVQRQSTQMLVIKKNVRVQRRRGATRNPIRALKDRTDIADEYTEVITGVAEREKKRLNIEKLAKTSNKALEALAGLASNEDFKSVALKKGGGPTTLLPWKDLMLLQVKGRRHVQTRLVEPVATSINEGDCFILITPGYLYNFVGAYSNVIEQSRAADIVNHIQKTGDMGCKVSKITTISSKDAVKRQLQAFWKLLGSDNVPEAVSAGHPNEDETYESNILATNMIYTIENDELVPYDKYWGSIPKIEMLQETSIIVFDFGSEMYVWSGKTAANDKKKLALKLAREMWEEGYDYNDCSICPLNVSSILGEREEKELPRKDEKRPDWALFAKITQHRETVLFREKFLDWPDFSRIIRVKSDDSIKSVTASFDIQPCDVEEMIKEKEVNPDLIIENTHLGRGNTYFDEETRRLFEYDTLEIKAWRIMEHTHEELPSIGQFYDGDSYIYSWKFRQTVRGRELNGKPSKHMQVGRDRCIFFCWHGTNSSINEKCTAAFLTVELDKQNAPQVRVVQGFEPAAFLRLFNGTMMIHRGKRGETNNVSNKSRLFIVRGEVEDEIYLMELPLTMESLRSRSSFVVLTEDDVIVWHGAKSSKQKRKVIKHALEKLMESRPKELNLPEDLEIVEMDEGSESEDFFDILGNNRELYMSLLESEEDFDYTMRMFRLSSVTGSFVATEVLCPHRSEHSSAYPFVQSELYTASQPALFFLDNDHELWLWQGWWPEKDIDEAFDESSSTSSPPPELSDQTGSGAVRWQAERRAAMRTAVSYWKKKKGEEEPVKAYLVWAGLEPKEFRNLFPDWCERKDVAELNIKEGKKNGYMLPLEKELALLSRTTYPLEEILSRPLPEGVDPTQLEIYLSPEDFQKLLSMTKEEFQKLPSWKKTALKKEKGLF